MSEEKGIYRTQLQGVGIAYGSNSISYGSNMPANSIMIDQQDFDKLKASIDAIKADCEEAQALIVRQRIAIEERDRLFMAYTSMEISYPTYIAEMLALMSTSSMTGRSEE